MNRALKISAIFLLAAMMMVLLVTLGSAHDTEPIRIYADQETALVNPLLMLEGLEGLDDLLTQWGDKQVFTESPEEAMTVFASIRKDGALAVLVINGDPENAHAAEIHIEGFKDSGPAVPYHLEAGELVKQEITVPLFESKFGYEFTPESITLFVIPGRSFPVIPLAVGATVLAGVAVGAVVFRRKRKN